MNQVNDASLLARYGRFVHRRRWAMLLVSAGLVAASIGGVLYGTSPHFNGSPTDTEAANADRLISTQLPQTSGSSFELLYSGGSLKVADPAFRSAMEASLSRLRKDSRVTAVRTPYSVPPPASASLESKDGHQALALVEFNDSAGSAPSYYPELRAEVASSAPLRVSATGQGAISAAFTDQLSRDLSIAGRASLPITVILLVLVFGTLIAALLPLGVGALSVVGGVGALFLLARFTDVSQYATELVALIGLGVGIDYSLFIVSRFREELARGSDPQDALAVAMSTSGRSVIFSGLTVAIGLSGLLFYRGSFLATLGLGGTFAVASAVLFAFAMLPALLAILGRRVDRLGLPMVGRRSGEGGFWRAVSTRVMRRPLLALVPALALLAAVAAPVMHMQLGSGDIKLLPPDQPARQALEQIAQNFPHRDQESMAVVLDYPSGSPVSAQRAAYAVELARTISAMPGVLSVDDPADPSATPEVRRAGTGAHIVELQVHSAYQPSTAQARSLVESVRSRPGPPTGRKLVTGTTAFVQDDVDWIVGHTLVAALFVMLTTYLVLFVLTGSVVLPLKAVLMNLVSLAAAFGALTWIFQDGHLSGLLNFTPQTLDPSVAVLIFCILFGLSMDYEVLMLTRIQEEWRRSGDTRDAVAVGLERSGRLVTGAAAIMIGVFLSFGLGGVVFIKAFGIGLAVAVAVDATIVRALVVPSVMCLLGRFNWWAPAPLDRLYVRLGLGPRYS
jgi:RND superfamily putative drug exporter